MGSVFKFKQFEVEQEGCAMRINTDGVMLAAMASQVQPMRILDIGTGTGVIALMMAQRFPEAIIDAVEIDETAALRAGQNFKASPFFGRLHAFCSAIETYETTEKYDLIITNPPFFINDLRNPEIRKSLARHASEDFFESLVLKAAAMLSEEGRFWLILPVKQADFVLDVATKKKLFLQQEISICSDKNKPVIRKIICLGRIAAPTDRTKFYIYETEGVYTEVYRHLLRDFFLAF